VTRSRPSVGAHAIVITPPAAYRARASDHRERFDPRPDVANLRLEQRWQHGIQIAPYARFSHAFCTPTAPIQVTFELEDLVTVHGLVVLASLLGCTATYAVSGKAETVAYSCGTPPNRQPARAVHVYRGGKRGDAVTDPIEIVKVSRDRTFSVRLPVGRYCLSTGDAPHICDHEVVVPGEPGSLTSVYATHEIPNRSRCDYQ
jgi:hypothetical protein